MAEFAQPWWFLLLPVPLLAWALLPATSGGGAALRMPERVAAGFLQAGAGGGRREVPWMAALAWCLLVVALAGPRVLAPVSALRVTGRDLAIAIDLSGSMVREDFALDGQAISRLEAVQRVGAEFARRRAGDRVALIFFGSEAYYAAPFTFDTEAVARRIEEAQIGISGRATNMADAVGLALKRMVRSEAATKVVILLSDGRTTRARPTRAVWPALPPRWACGSTPSPWGRRLWTRPKRASAAWWMRRPCGRWRA